MQIQVKCRARLELRISKTLAQCMELVIHRILERCMAKQVQDIQ
jgi:hypothetical protein